VIAKYDEIVGKKLSAKEQKAALEYEEWYRRNCLYRWRTKECVDLMIPHSFKEEHVIGDVESLFTNVSRKELMEFINKEIPEISILVSKHLEATTFKFHGMGYRWIEGIDMGSKVSPLLSCFYVSCKLRGYREKFHQLKIMGSIYVDDIGLKQLTGNSKGELRECKEWIDEKLAPLVVKWNDCERGVEYMDCVIKGAWFRDFNSRGRRLTLTKDHELPRSVIESAICNEIRRIDDRTMQKWEDLRVVKPDGTHSNLESDKAAMFHNAKGFDPFVDYLAIQHEGNTTKCFLCRMMVRAFAPKIEKKQTHILNLTWSILLESKAGRKAVMEYLSLWSRALEKECSIRWKFYSKKISSLIFHRDPFDKPKSGRRTNPYGSGQLHDAPDEIRGGIETDEPLCL
jgi:hypothetical protein